MVVGSLKVKIAIPDFTSLKDKRRVLQSVRDKLKKTFNVAIAEIDYRDHCKTVGLGIVTVANDARHVNSILSSILGVLKSRPDAIVLENDLEIF